MKRRDFLKGAGAGAIVVPITAKGITVPVEKSDLVEKSDENIYTPSNHLTYSVSDDISDFIISYNHINKFIDIKPRKLDVPALNMAAYHRHILDQLDRPFKNDSGFDILDAPPHELVTPNIMQMINGWTLTPNALKTLYGGVIQGNKKTCTIQVLRNVNANYNRVKDIKVMTDGGHKMFYDTGGIFTSPLLDDDRTYIMEIHYRYRGFDVWEQKAWKTSLSCGLVFIPFLS